MAEQYRVGGGKRLFDQTNDDKLYVALRGSFSDPDHPSRHWPGLKIDEDGGVFLSDKDGTERRVQDRAYLLNKLRPAINRWRRRRTKVHDSAIAFLEKDRRPWHERLYEYLTH